jgi:dolichol-phosphate mannosyltransferase
MNLKLPISFMESSGFRNLKGNRCIIILPCYNEEQNVQDLVLSLGEMLSKCLCFHIVVVDDGSTDKTLEISKGLASIYPITIVRHSKNLGLGAALKDGLSTALELTSDNDFIVTMDADNTHKPECIPKMLKLLNNGADIVIASRYIRGGLQLNVPFHRIFLSRAINLILRFLTGVPVHDITSGFRAFKVTVLREAVRHFGDRFITSRGFEVAVEILIKMYWYGGNNIRICELPLVLDYSVKKGRSKMKLFYTIMRYIKILPKLVCWARK